MDVGQSICAVITRALFILVSLVGVYRVRSVKNDRNYWFLTFLFLPLVTEMIITLKRRKGKDYKWFSPPIFLFLISIIPSIWILELHHQENKSSCPECHKLDSWESLKKILTLNETSRNSTSKFAANLKFPPQLRGHMDVYGTVWKCFFFFLSTLESLSAVQPGLTAEIDRLQFCMNQVVIQKENLKAVLASVCSNDWILALHQILLILLIVGKWLLPRGGGVTRDELLELLLVFVGTAADILEFTNETLSDLKDKSPVMVYIILGVWTWSMLQFPLHLPAMNSKPESDGDLSTENKLRRNSTDIWNIMEALFFQDGPFLVVRLTVMILFETIHQMLVFFAIKNSFVIILNLYRLFVLCNDYKSSHRSPVPSDDEVG